MKGLPMVDLASQYQKIKGQIDKAIIDVVESTAFINGPEVKAFSDELANYLGVKHVIPCANGTDALQIAMMGLGLKPGDEVITPSFTYVATVEVIALLGLVPVFVDVDPDTFTMDLSALEKAITPKTKAIVPVHLYGQCAEMEGILSIASKHNLAVVEDTAQAIGADYIFKDGKKAKAGTIGDIGTTSFFPSKNLGCYGDGGALFTNNDELATVIRKIANHGQEVRYYHSLVGVNSRLDSIQAAILRVKLPHLDGYNDARRNAADLYDKAFAPYEQISTPKRADYSTHVFHQYTLKLTGVNRDGLIAHLGEHGIPAMLYYPVPVHRQEAYKHLTTDESHLKNTNDLTDVVLSLPMHSELEESTVSFISETLIKFLK
ncbi:DegT/DnrJ/EryC1/StrS family aminotransferase [Luteibaculum oceani]|uniref:DegT/DnrJ/EryC1/StrS family aminotransferase n=1 Tax=Luteibaculum oceani TaxID=1294296 RepID=A0A5C6VBC5_9FLAO|nr:DegT/DnrJ/EryC1/StrS family aminotransferase [Luteibaculum oceani]TXC81696.1 DegT/DnrJ/EryC1/StrS family aminotransferase [Luteibaculum oceani]